MAALTKATDDVTLACDRGKKCKTHKLVLSASSSVFIEIVTDSSLHTAVIFQRWVDQKFLNILLDFIYHGEVDLLEVEMEPFLNLAA